MTAIFVPIFFFAAGLVFLFWPDKIRGWSLKSRAKAGFKKPLFMQKLMFTRAYIVSFRVGGIISIGVSILLLLAYLRQIQAI